MLKQSLCAIALATTALAAHADIIEGFDDVATLAGKGFVLSQTGSGFVQGNQDVFVAQAGAETNSYLAAGYFSADANGVVSNTLITPIFNTTYNGLFSFFAKADILAPYLDQFQIGFSNGSTDLADFVFGSVMTATADWTEFSSAIIGTGISSSAGRFAIRYAGTVDSVNYIGIDSLAVRLPEPASALLLGLGLVGLAAARRKKSM